MISNYNYALLSLVALSAFSGGCNIDYTIQDPKVTVKSVSLCVVVNYGTEQVFICPDGGAAGDSGDQ